MRKTAIKLYTSIRPPKVEKNWRKPIINSSGQVKPEDSGLDWLMKHLRGPGFTQMVLQVKHIHYRTTMVDMRCLLKRICNSFEMSSLLGNFRNIGSITAPVFVKFSLNSELLQLEWWGTKQLGWSGALWKHVKRGQVDWSLLYRQCLLGFCTYVSPLWSR